MMGYDVPSYIIHYDGVITYYMSAITINQLACKVYHVNKAY